jgi:hypothetical protein
MLSAVFLAQTSDVFDVLYAAAVVKNSIHVGTSLACQHYASFRATAEDCRPSRSPA